MDPTARMARRMQPGAYLSKGADPGGDGVLNKREQQRSTNYRNPGMVGPGEQQGVPGNPRIFDSHSDSANPQLLTNLYGDWQKSAPQTAPIEVTPTPPAAKLAAQPWQDDSRLDQANGMQTMAMLQARTGPSPITMPPNAAVLDGSHGAVEGVSGYQAPAMLPSAPQLSFEDMATPVRPGAQVPLPASMDLDPRFAPYTVVGQPSDGRLPAAGQQFNPGRGKPSTMPQPRPA